MDTYCWIHSTFSVPSRVAGVDGVDRAHAGVAPHSDLEPGQEVRYHKYYQWVCFTLFFQAILFYIPRYCIFELFSFTIYTYFCSFLPRSLTLGPKSLYIIGIHTSAILILEV